MKDARFLVRVLADPSSAAALNAEQWTALIAMARGEMLVGSLAFRLEGTTVPSEVQNLLEDARRAADQARTQALWEAEMARRALAPLGVPVVLLKGTAYAAAGLDAGVGRSIGDLDILVPREALGAVEQALIAAGWEWVKPDPYDDLYYRRWMHELPPLIHRERDRMIDVHHTILPLTAKPKPDAEAMIAASVPLGNGLSVLRPDDMVIHAAAHLIADGDLSGGLRNLWDIDRLCRQFSKTDADFSLRIYEEAWYRRLGPQTVRALRLARQIYGTPVREYSSPVTIGVHPRRTDYWFRRRLLARDCWGRETRGPLRLAFYARSHWMRMPPPMLARHLWTKARRGRTD